MVKDQNPTPVNKGQAKEAVKQRDGEKPKKDGKQGEKIEQGLSNCCRVSLLL